MVAFTSTITTLAFALSATAATIAKRQGTGDATFYTPGLGACGQTNGEGDLVAAVSSATLGADKSGCGRQIRVTGAAGSVDVTIVDLCPSCAPASVDLSPTAFQAAVGDLGIGRAQVSWDFI